MRLKPKLKRKAETKNAEKKKHSERRRTWIVKKGEERPKAGKKKGPKTARTGAWKEGRRRDVPT